MVPLMLALTLLAVPARPMSPPELLAALAVDAGWSQTEVACAARIVWLESRWDPKSANPKSSAYGLFQEKRLSRSSTVVTQIQHALRYFAHRYHNSPCLALAFHKRHGWY